MNRPSWFTPPWWEWDNDPGCEYENFYKGVAGLWLMFSGGFVGHLLAGGPPEQQQQAPAPPEGDTLDAILARLLDLADRFITLAAENPVGACVVGVVALGGIWLWRRGRAR